jgi:hypothetical protein
MCFYAHRRQGVQVSRSRRPIADSESGTQIAKANRCGGGATRHRPDIRF